MKESRQEVITRIDLEDNDAALQIFGEGGENLKRFERRLGVRIATRGAVVTIQGAADKVDVAGRVITEVADLVSRGYALHPTDLDYAVRILSADRNARLADIFLDTLLVSFKKKRIVPKSVAQKRYIDAMRRSDMVFCIGPAGTGKSYLAMAAAVAALTEKKVDRIILTRPAVEAGEKLGFLPGDLAAKVDPYLRPLYDALYDMMDFDRASRLIERGTIEVAPLAFMRGRTLNDSFVILDEAQNTTLEQMKMFLTRLGFGSKAVITGDITQVDLPLATPSGLVEVIKVLESVSGIEFVYFSELDVVRHPLVQDIVKAFDRLESRKKSRIVEEL